MPRSAPVVSPENSTTTVMRLTNDFLNENSKVEESKIVAEQNTEETSPLLNQETSSTPNSPVHAETTTPATTYPTNPNKKPSFCVRLTQDSYSTAFNTWNRCKDVNELRKSKESFVMSKLYDRAEGPNIAWIQVAPQIVATMTRGYWPSRVYVVRGLRINAQKVADYGENNMDPHARDFLNFTAEILGRDTLGNQIGEKARIEKGLLKKQLNKLQIAADVANRRFTELVDKIDAQTSYQNWMTYLSANILGECVLGIPELKMEYIPELRKVGEALLDWNNHALIKKCSAFVTRMNIEVLAQNKDRLVDSFKKPDDGDNENKFISDDLNRSIIEAESNEEILGQLQADRTFKEDYLSRKRQEFSNNPELLLQKLLNRRGVSIFAGESNITNVIMQGIVEIERLREVVKGSLEKRATVKERLTAEIKAYRSNNRLSPTDEIPVEDLRELPYLQAVYYETLRYSSSTPMIARRTSMESTIEIKDASGKKQDYIIPAHSLLFVPMRKMQHDKRIWGENALEFDPSRFLVEEQKVPTEDKTPQQILDAKILAAKEMRDRVLSFSTGQRQCPAGAGFVEAAAMAIWAKSVLNYEFRFTEEIKPVPTDKMLTYWPKDYFAIVTKLSEEPRAQYRPG